MPGIASFNIRSFKQIARQKKRKFRTFLTKLEKNPPRGLDKLMVPMQEEVWQQTDCLACANCCKTMTPTFNAADIKRISAHFGMSIDDFKAKWLRKEKGGDGDWLNKTEPCQFLNPEDNKCSIYDVRPADCAGFPHLSKKIKDYVHVHKQNIEYCPATFRMVEKMMERVRISNR